MNSEFNTNSNIPKLRFPEFSGEWEEKKINDIVLEKNKKSITNNQFPILSSSMGGIYLQSDYFNKQTASQNNIGYKIIEREDFVYRSMSDTGYFTFNLQNLIDIGIVSPAYPVFKNTKNIKSKYLLYVLNNDSYIKKQILILKEGGTRFALSFSKFAKLKINLPTLPEQQKIASFLESVDSYINNLKTQKESLEEYKKGIMQQIFAQEIRFKDENGKDFPDWEEKKLGEFIKEEVQKTTKNNQHPVLSSTKNTICLQSDYFNKEIASSNNIGYKVLKRNQLVFSPQNIWLGNININTYYDIGIVSPSYKIYNIKQNFVLVDYIRYIIKLPRMLFEYEISSEQGASVVRRNLNINLFHNIRLNLPSLHEQQKIASFLSSLDDQIQLKTQQIEKAEEWKKGLMQGLFV